MFWEKKLTQWVEEVRNQTNLPARLVLWDGQQHDFGTFAAPQVTLKVNSASALPLLLEPSLDNLGEAYVKARSTSRASCPTSSTSATRWPAAR
jgi:cyclopropane-fatty-acyl-phospholipid synthase